MTTTQNTTTLYKKLMSPHINYDDLTDKDRQILFGELNADTFDVFFNYLTEEVQDNVFSNLEFLIQNIEEKIPFCTKDASWMHESGNIVYEGELTKEGELLECELEILKTYLSICQESPVYV